MTKQKIQSSFKPSNKKKITEEEKELQRVQYQPPVSTPLISKKKKRKTRIKQGIFITLSLIMVFSMMLPYLAGLF